MPKMITAQKDTAAYVIPQNQYRVNSTMHYNAETQKVYVLTIKSNKTHETSADIEQSDVTRRCTARKYQSHFKNVVKSIILMVRLKTDNELKSVMFSGK